MPTCPGVCRMSLLSLLYDHLEWDVPGRDISALGYPQAARLCLTQLGEQVLSAGAEWGGWPRSSFWRFPRSWAVMLWDTEGSRCLLASCQSTGSVDRRALEQERDSAVARAVFPTSNPCLNFLHASTALAASPMTGLRICLCCHLPALGERAK